MSAHQLHDECLPRRVYTNSFRQLFSECNGWRKAHQPGPVGYGGAGGLRSAATPILPTDWRVPHMLLARQPCLLRERSREVVPRSSASLPVHAHHPGRHKVRSSRRQGHHWETEGEEACTHHVSTRPKHGEGDWRSEVSGVLSANAKGSQDGVWRGHTRRVVPRAAAQKTAEMSDFLKTIGI